MKNVVKIANTITYKPEVLIYLLIVVITGCSNFQLKKNKLDGFVEKNLMLIEKQELILKIIDFPDSLESFIKASIFYDSKYSETFFSIDMQTTKTKKLYKIVSDDLKLYKIQDFALSLNQTYIIGPDKLNWEYFHRLEYKIKSEKHEKLMITFVLKDDLWYFVDMLVVRIYE